MIFRGFAGLVWDRVSFHLSWNWLSICPPRNSFTTSHHYDEQLLLYLLNCLYLNPQICIDFTLLILFPILMGAVWGLPAYCVKPQQKDSKDKQTSNHLHSLWRMDTCSLYQERKFKTFAVLGYLEQVLKLYHRSLIARQNQMFATQDHLLVRQGDRHLQSFYITAGGGVCPAGGRFRYLWGRMKNSERSRVNLPFSIFPPSFFPSFFFFKALSIAISRKEKKWTELTSS